MNVKLFYKFINITEIVFLVIFIILLGRSVIISGYSYSFFGDEMFHVNYVYLIASGNKIFMDFWMYFSPVLHWFLSPVFMIFGFIPETIYKARIVMVGIYVLRLFFLATFVSRLTDYKTGLLIILLYLLDPFTVFTGMQLRPENLAFMFISLGLLLTSYVFGNKRKLLFIGAIFLSLTVITTIKLTPSIAVTCLTVLVILILKKQFAKILIFLSGLIIPPALFSLYFIIQGSFNLMIQQLFLDVIAQADSIMNPTHFGYFYEPNNNFLYGFMGKPLNWYYVFVLLALGVLGIILMFVNSIKHKNIQLIFLSCITGFSFILQFFSIVRLKNVFIQYYQPHTFFSVIGAAYLLNYLTGNNKNNILFRVLPKLVVLIMFFFVVRVSIDANIIRSGMNGANSVKNLNRILKILPRDAKIYPGYIFRPLTYPIPYGFFMPEISPKIKSRYPDPVSFWITNNIKYILMSDYEIQNSGGDVVYYLIENYSQSPEIPYLWVKK